MTTVHRMNERMRMTREKLNKVKWILNSLLIPHSAGLTVDRLLLEYLKVEGQALPYRWVRKYE